MKNDLFLRVLRGEKVERTPVWIMRQAGRYLAEYRKLRAKVPHFLDVCRNPKLACELALQPLQRFPLDAAILFSDILTIPDAMGLGLSFVAGEGPQFAKPLRSSAAIESLTLPPSGSLDYVFAAVSATKRALNDRVPLIGFAGSPWTLAAYMIEGGASKDFAFAKSFAFSQPQAMDVLLTQLTCAITDYLRGQIKAGAQAVMIFDSWGGVLPYWAYEQFSLPYLKKIVAAVHTVAPVIVFTKGGGLWLAAQKTIGAAALGVDWTVSLAAARKIVGESIVLQGNLDPAFLMTDPKTIRQAVAKTLADYGNGHRYIFNLGHGITPNASPDNVAAMIEAVHELSPQYHQ